MIIDILISSIMYCEYIAQSYKLKTGYSHEFTSDHLLKVNIC